MNSVSNYPEWMSLFHKKCLEINGTRCFRKLDELMEFYIKYIKDEIIVCTTSPNRSKYIASNIYKTMLFFHGYYIEVKEFFVISQWNKYMIELLSMYCQLEMRAAMRKHRGKENDEAICKRIMTVLWIYLNKSEEHMIHVLLKIKDYKERHKDIFEPIFKKLLITNQHTKPLTDLEYIRNLLAFKLWKRLYSKDEKKATSNLAVARLKPPRSFITHSKRYKFLPRYSGKSNVNEFLVKTKLKLDDVIKEYFVYLNYNEINSKEDLTPRWCQEIIKLAEEESFCLLSARKELNANEAVISNLDEYQDDVIIVNDIKMVDRNTHNLSSDDSELVEVKSVEPSEENLDLETKWDETDEKVISHVESDVTAPLINEQSDLNSMELDFKDAYNNIVPDETHLDTYKPEKNFQIIVTKNLQSGERKVRIYNSKTKLDLVAPFKKLYPHLNYIQERFQLQRLESDLFCPYINLTKGNLAKFVDPSEQLANKLDVEEQSNVKSSLELSQPNQIGSSLTMHDLEQSRTIQGYYSGSSTLPTTLEPECCLPLKKRKVSSPTTVSDILSSAIDVDISYPATPMISIAALETISRPFRTPAELKEMPPLPASYLCSKCSGRRVRRLPFTFGNNPNLFYFPPSF